MSKQIFVILSQVGIQGHILFESTNKNATFEFITKALDFRYDNTTRFYDKYSKRIYKLNDKIRTGHFILAPVNINLIK